MIRTKNVRNTTKFKRSIKAISPVIATLLMIAIAVVASLVVYAWVTGYIGGTTSTAGKAIQIQSFASQGGNLVIYVQNVGQGDVELNKDQSVYVDSNLVSITLPATLKISIPVGQTVALLTDEPYTAGTKVNIKVTTTDGTFMTITGTGTSGGSGGSGTNHNVVVTQTANGAIAPGGTTSYAAGSTPSFTITPDVGYHIESVTTNAGAQALTSPYVFPALSADATLTATFAANVVTPITITLRPTGTGSSNSLENNDGSYPYDPQTSNWAYVDESSADGDTTFVYKSGSSTSWTRDTYGTENTAITTGTITSVTVYARCRDASGDGQGRVAIRTNSQNYVGSDTALTTGNWVNIVGAWNNNPQTSSAWTWSQINALEIGVELQESGNGYDMRCTQVWVEVTYTP